MCGGEEQTRPSIRCGWNSISLSLRHVNFIYTDSLTFNKVEMRIVVLSVLIYKNYHLISYLLLDYIICAERGGAESLLPTRFNLPQCLGAHVRVGTMYLIWPGCRRTLGMPWVLSCFLICRAYHQQFIPFLRSSS